MRLKIHHSLGVISLVCGYSPTEAGDLIVKDTFYAMLETGIVQCPGRDSLQVFGDLNASI